MVSFKLSFLLQFELTPSYGYDEGKQRKKGGDKRTKGKNKSKSDKSSKSSKKSKKDTKNDNKVETIHKRLPKYVREVDKPIGYAHIEYNLIPNRQKHVLDVVFWGSIVKVFAGDDAKIMTTIRTESGAWVLIQIVHYTNVLDTDEIYDLHAHVLNITVSTSKNQCGTKAKAENTKTFYLMEEDDETEEIVEAFADDQNLIERDEKHWLNSFIQDIIRDCYSKPAQKDEIVTLLDHDRTHYYRANKIIKDTCKGVTIKTKQYAPICLPPVIEEDENRETDSFVKVTIKKSKAKKNAKEKATKKDNKKKDNKKKKSKESVKSKKPKVCLKFTVPGEVFVTDPRLSIYAMENSDPYLKNGFLLMSVNDLFTARQSVTLNPLIISIDSLKNVPTGVLSRYGFTDLYAEYNVPYIARCKSLIKPLEVNTAFDEAHAHFIEHISNEKLFKFVLIDPFFIKIVGIRNVDDNKENGPFDSCHLSAKLAYNSYVLKMKEKRSEVVLATFAFDLSNLIKPYHFCNEHNNDAVPEMVFFGCNKQRKFKDVESVNYINITTPESTIECENVLQNLLVEYATTLSVKIKFYAPIPSMGRPNLPLDPKFFRRLLIIFFDRHAFENVTRIVYIHNRSNDRTDQTLRMSSNADDNDESDVDDDLLTGFVIDDGDNAIVYVEGICTGMITRLLYVLNSYSDEAVKPHFNSKLLFEKRLYRRFISTHGGMFKINLVHPLRRLLRKQRFYVSGNVPLGCFNAVLKLNMLHDSTSLISMCKENMFPTTEELMSLNVELGLPRRNRIDYHHMSFGQPEYVADDCINEDLICIGNMY